MSVSVDAKVCAMAESVLTEKQLVAWLLESAGLSARSIGLALDVSKTTVHDRLDAAHRKLRRAGVSQDASGRWKVIQQTSTKGVSSG